MNIIVKTPAAYLYACESSEPALETEAFLLANIHHGPVRKVEYKAFEYVANANEREIIAERLAEMGLK